MNKLMKIILVSALILIPLNVVGGDYLDTFSEYRYEIREALGTDGSNTSFLADSILNTFVRNAGSKINQQIGMLEVVDTIITSANVGTYSLTPIGVLSAEWFNKDSSKALLYLPKEQWFQYDIKLLTGRQDYYLRPTFYDYIDAYLFLYPTPTQADSIRITGWRKFYNITSTDSLVNIPQQYRVLVLEYATYKAAQKKQHPLTEFYRKDYEESLMSINLAVNKKREKVGDIK